LTQLQFWLFLQRDGYRTLGQYATNPGTLPERYEKRKAPRDDRPAKFQYCLRAWLSREPRRMGAPHGSSCEAVNDCSTPNECTTRVVCRSIVRLFGRSDYFSSRRLVSSNRRAVRLSCFGNLTIFASSSRSASHCATHYCSSASRIRPSTLRLLRSANSLSLLIIV
jgi:hypothetical protein